MIVIKFIIGVLACAMLWFAVDHGRNERVRFGSSDWWAILLMITISIVVIDNLDKWFVE